jgi:tetratricopeptide (TPR) repeat protein
MHAHLRSRSWRRPVRHAVSAFLPLMALLNVAEAGVERAQDHGREGQLKRWLAAVTRHQAGTPGAAAIEIAAWPESQLSGVVADIGELARFLPRAHVRRLRTGQPSTFRYDDSRLSMLEIQQLLGLTDDEARRGDVSRLANRGCLLHTDIAVTLDHLDQRTRSAAPSDTPTALLVLDGRQQGLVDRGPHWGIARSLLDLIPADSPRADLKRKWYVATAAYMQSRMNLADLVPHLVKARQLLPADPDVLFYSAAMNETMAAPLIQQAVSGASMTPDTKLDVTDARTHLQDARTFLRRALESRPDHVEARVRLGRVLGALGQHAEAVHELERARIGSPNPVVRYYATLFLGGELARLGRADEARKAYEAAAALYPDAQAPRLGLSSLARAAGNQRAAAQVLLQMLAIDEPDASRDPWWTYFRARKDESDQLLEGWRRTVEEWGTR